MHCGTWSISLDVRLGSSPSLSKLTTNQLMRSLYGQVTAMFTMRAASTVGRRIAVVQNATLVADRGNCRRVGTRSARMPVSTAMFCVDSISTNLSTAHWRKGGVAPAAEIMGPSSKRLTISILAGGLATMGPGGVTPPAGPGDAGPAGAALDDAAPDELADSA
jgi:hypothetical protein